jgi:phosphatidylglycerol:prolipoprotein diacylglycerol transferase
MHPILVKLGPINIFTYGMFLALAFLSAILVAGREAKRNGCSPAQVYDLCFYIVLAAIVGSRLFHVILELPYFLAHPGDIFLLWKGGLAFQGGLILGIPVAFLYMRWKQMPILQTFDFVAVGMPLGQFIGRVGCFMAGCCYGTDCHLPWAVTFNNPDTLAPMGVPLHPTQLYEAFLALGVFGVLLWWRRRKSFNGQLLGLYLLLAGLVRFVVEFFRGDERGPIIFAGMVATQAVALGLVVVSGLFLWWGSRRRACCQSQS